MRQLVTIRTVAEIRPIKGADLIELAIIDGWQCVVKKGEFKVGDRGLYFEIDSFLPGGDPRFKFLEPRFTTFKDKLGARIRTIKLRGEVSQGLLLPLSEFPEIKVNSWVWEMDYSEQLGVLKWEREDSGNNTPQNKPTWLGRKLRQWKHTKLKPVIAWVEQCFPNLLSTAATRPFPSFIRKTDQERVQNLIGKLDLTSEEEYEATIKLDGSSMTAYHNRKKLGVCSRNLDLKKDKDNKFWAAAIEYNVLEPLKRLGVNIAIQGELMGPGIQGNREELKSLEYYIFDVYLIDEQRYATPSERYWYLAKLYLDGMTAHEVPNLGNVKLNQFKNIDDFLAFAEGKSLFAEKREGVCFKRLKDAKSFKVISNSYLLKHGE